MTMLYYPSRRLLDTSEDSLRTSRCFKDIVIVAIEYEDIAWLP